MNWKMMFAVVLCLIAVCLPASAGQNLPTVAGTALRCDQGNNDTPTHGGKLKYAWDFSLNGTSGNQDLGYPIVAAEEGTVVYAEDYVPNYIDEWGNCIVLKYGSGDFGLYAHCEHMFVGVGEWIESGQVIATLGNADGRWPAHIHYQRQEGDDPNGQSIPSSFVEAGVPIAGDVDVSRNNGLLDQAYDRYGPDWIGYPEYQMWDLGK